jgi:predicted nucleotidyltransferase
MQSNPITLPSPLTASRLYTNSILKTLAYFDMFAYPLSKEEIRLFMDIEVKMDLLDTALEQLLQDGAIFRFEQFYLLRPDPDLVSRRKEGNVRAAQLMKKANRISAFLYSFPFVRGVGISGSLSKNFADAQSDIDFFIITKANRLWIARTCMHLFKKLTFITGKQHWFCMNYYVDEHALQIAEKNIFTATEVATLIPACGHSAFNHFFRANNWVREHFPNQSVKTRSIIRAKESLFKRCMEYCLNTKAGQQIDNYLMKLTSGRWKQKEAQRHLNARGGRMGLCTGKHFARPNPAFFQKSILENYRERLKELKVEEVEGRERRLRDGL